MIDKIQRYIKAVVDQYGEEGVPPAVIMRPSTEKLIDLIENEKVMYLVTDKNNVLGNVVFKEDISDYEKSDILNYLESKHKDMLFSEALLKYYPINQYLDSNYYCKVNESIVKYEKNKWLKSRKVVLKGVEFRELTESDIPAVKFIMKTWTKNKARTKYVGYKEMYKNIVEKGNWVSQDYKGCGLFYNGVLIMFRYYRESESATGKHCHVDLENGLSSLSEDILDKFVLDISKDYIDNCKADVTNKAMDIKNKFTSMDAERELHKNNKNWKEVKKIDNERDTLRNSYEQLKNWKVDCITDLKKFILDSSINTNRYLFMKYLKDNNFTHYMEDFAVDDDLREYKSKKNDYEVKYYTVRGTFFW
ncbi:MAG: hypothetical protein ACRC0R_02635 [Cetobacterium sp.]